MFTPTMKDNKFNMTFIRQFFQSYLERMLAIAMLQFSEKKSTVATENKRVVHLHK